MEELLEPLVPFSVTFQAGQGGAVWSLTPPPNDQFGLALVEDSDSLYFLLVRGSVDADGRLRSLEVAACDESGYHQLHRYEREGGEVSP